jgi:molybdopterin synthase sulfur carrier subunit
VKCFATLADHTPPQGFLDLEEGAAVEAMLPLLGLASADIKLVFVNSRNSSLEARLADGDQVGIFPAVGGG